MATQEQIKSIIASALAGLSVENQAIVSASAPGDVKAAIDSIFSQTGKTNMTAAAKAIIDGTVDNWAAAETILANAQSSSVTAALTDFKSLVAAHDPDALAVGFVASCAALKHFGL